MPGTLTLLDGPKLFDTLIVFEKVNSEKSADDNKSMKNYPAC